MPDRRKVIKSLETAVKNFERYSGDEYGREYDYARVGVDVLEDALTLLKAQEPVDAIPVEWIQAQVDNEKRAPLFRRYAEALLTIWQMEKEARDAKM